MLGVVLHATHEDLVVQLAHVAPVHTCIVPSKACRRPRDEPNAFSRIIKVLHFEKFEAKLYLRRVTTVIFVTVRGYLLISIPTGADSWSHKVN